MFCSEENWDSNGATEDWDTEDFKPKPHGTGLFFCHIGFTISSKLLCSSQIIY